MNTLVNGVNYSNLFAITLPETILEIVSLVVLVVDLGILRKSAQATRMAAACMLGVLGCTLSMLWLFAHPQAAGLATDTLVGTPLVAAVHF